MNVNLKQRFQEILEDNRILEAELMSRHTTFRIGGPADFFLVPENADEMKMTGSMPRQELFYLELLQLQERHR